MASENYKPLLSGPEDRTSVDGLSDTDLRPLKPKSWSSRLVTLLSRLRPYIIAILSLLLAIHFYLDKRSFHSRCVRELHTPCERSPFITPSFCPCSLTKLTHLAHLAPILNSGVLDKYSTVNLNGTLNFKEKWAGTPNDARDEQWQSIIKGEYGEIPTKSFSFSSKEPKEKD